MMSTKKHCEQTKMSETLNVNLRPKDVADWLGHQGDSFGESGDTDFQNKLYAMADDIKQMYDPALYDGSEESDAMDECQSHAWQASHTGFKFCPDCGNPLSTHR